MRRSTHILALLAFIAAPLIVAARPQPLPMEIAMCGHESAVLSLRLPVAPLPMSPNHCDKACHAGCLRKRKTDTAPDAN